MLCAGQAQRFTFNLRFSGAPTPPGSVFLVQRTDVSKEEFLMKGLLTFWPARDNCFRERAWRFLAIGGSPCASS